MNVFSVNKVLADYYVCKHKHMWPLANRVANMLRLWIVSPRCINMRKWAGCTICVNGFMIYQIKCCQQGDGVEKKAIVAWYQTDLFPKVNFSAICVKFY